MEHMSPQGSYGCYDQERPKAGLKDGGHVILECSSCSQPLIDVWVIKEDSVEHSLKAKCCYCGDHSFVKKVKGRIAVAGISKPNPDDAEDFLPVTRWVGVKQEGAVKVFLTEKASGS